jgi:hypothetical protein
MDNQIKTTAEAVEAAHLAELYAVRVGPDGEAKSENQVVECAPGSRPLDQKSPAEWAYERIVMYIQKFEETLNADEEIGLGFAGGNVGTLRIQGMGYFAPDIITFYGQDPDGAKTQLIQHVTQLNVMLVAAPKEQSGFAANRIGFKLADKLREKG